MVGRRGRRVTSVAAVAALLVVLASCRLHGQFTIREAPDAPVTFRLLAGDGRHVVVEATGAGATVPGAGWWRVDREDGSTDPLPAPAVRISADGARVLLQGGGLWQAGAVTTLPGAWSDDLAHRAYLSGGRVWAQPVGGGPAVDVEAAYPRPAGTTAVDPLGISDDGLTVWYRLQGSYGTRDRHVRLGTPGALDLPRSGVDGDLVRAHQVAAGGSALARKTQRYEDRYDPETGSWVWALVDTTVELIAIPSGTVLASTVGTGDLDAVRIAEDGSRIWFTTNEWYDACDFRPPETWIPCIVSVSLSVLSPSGSRTFSMGQGSTLVGFDITPDGTLAVVDQDAFWLAQLGLGTPPKIFHAVEGEWEVLRQGPQVTTSDSLTCTVYGGRPPPCTHPVHGSAAQISDDGTVVSSRTMTDRGWYDYVDPPEPPA
jgi:hypothetical protein